MQVKELYKVFKQCRGISIDSRSIKSGELFIAMKGENFNGNEYASKALEAGAKFALIDDPSVVNNSDKYIVVDDSLKTLQKLATFHREQFDGKVIAITGSNGKTTSKELAQAVLSSQFNSYATVGNLNNHIGTPLTLLRMPTDLDFAIIELGDNQPGEISMLCEIALPDYGIVTNVGKDHLEGFGSWQGVFDARMEMFDHLQNHQKKAFVNLDIEYLEEMSENLNEVITYGSDPRADFRYELISASPFVICKAFGKETFEITSQLFGVYNFENLELAATIGQYFGVASGMISKAIGSYLPRNNRSQILDFHGNKVLLDAYNANPSNMVAALDSFATIDSNQKMVILGDMLELGKYTETEHKQIGEKLKSMNLADVILVGEHFKPIAEEFGYQHFENVEKVKTWLMESMPVDHWILIKGSRKIGLEKIVD